MTDDARAAPRGIGIADCQRVQAAWFRALATAGEGSTWRDGPLEWAWLGPSLELMLLFPEHVRAEALSRGLERARALGVTTVGVWLALEVEAAAAAALSDAGFERGWSPWWMTVPTASLGAAVDPRVTLEDGVPEEADPAARAQLAVARIQPRRAWRAAARVDGRSAGHAWAFLDGDVAGVFDMAVWPPFRRRGLGTGLLRAACAAAAAAGARDAILNATPEGERLYSSVGFQRIGEGITWWWHA